MDQAELDQLLRRARAADPAALAALVDRFSDRLLGLLFRLTGRRDAAEELVQETFVRVIRTLGEYDERGRFEAWLFRIATNLARDRVRSHKRRRGSGFLDGAGSSSRDPVADACTPLAASGPDAQVELAERAHRLQEALGRLPPADREILLLRHYSDMPFRDIAKLLDVPLGTALARVHRALARLRADLGDAT